MTLRELARRHGGVVAGDVGGGARAAEAVVSRLVPVEQAQAGDLAPVLASRFVRAGQAAEARGASLLVDESVAAQLRSERAWVHPHAAWAMAEVLDTAEAPETPAHFGEGCAFGAHVVLAPRVAIGARVRIDASSVIGRPGFGWAFGIGGVAREMPQLGGVVIEDDVVIGPLCTIDAGTLTPTRIRRGAKLDAQVHVGHNCDIGEETIVAAQSGFAGSVKIGRGVLIGGQVGVADHVSIGDGARVAAKSGVIGDIPAGAVVAGYPAVSRMRWLRALAKLYRGLA